MSARGAPHEPVPLWVVRHPPVLVQGVCYGQADVPAPLTEEAFRALVARLPNVSRIWTSSSRRCRELAERLAEHTRVAVSTHDELREICFGAFEGLTWTEIEQKYPEAYRTWMADWRSSPPPDGESLATFTARIGRAFDRIAHMTRREQAPCAPLVVTHAGVVRALLHLREGLDWDEALGRAVPHLEPRLVRW